MITLALLALMIDPPCPAFVDHAQDPMIYHQPANVTDLTLSSSAGYTIDSNGKVYESGAFWLPSVRVGKLYCSWILAEGGKPPYVYSASGIPRGMALDSATGAFQGRPNKPGVYQVVFTVTDSQGAVFSVQRQQTICEVASKAPCN